MGDNGGKGKAPEGSQGSAPPGLIVYTSDFGPITKLKVPSFRNGDISLAKSLLIKPTIPAAYHWRPVQHLTPGTAMENTEAFVKTAEVALAMDGSSKLTDAQKRKQAICVGVARAVATDLYSISNEDLIPGETAPALLDIQKNGEEVTGYRAAEGLSPEVSKKLSESVGLDETERSVVAAIHMSSIGIPPVQGYSIVMTDHHYLSDAKSQSNRAFAAIEKQFWETSAVKQWFSEDVEIIRDALWHKACHPISMSLKTALAHDSNVAKMIQVAGAGSAASRLPVLESELRAANSYKTLLQTVRPMYESMGATTNYMVLDEAIATVSLFPYGIQVGEVQLMKSIPRYVNSRSKALMHLKFTLEGNTDSVAHAYGFYCALAEQGQLMTGGSTGDSLKTSFSLKKLKNQSYASYIAGQAMHGDYVAMKASRRAAGQYEKVNLILYGVTDGGVMVGDSDV